MRKYSSHSLNLVENGWHISKLSSYTGSHIISLLIICYSPSLCNSLGGNSLQLQLARSGRRKDKDEVSPTLLQCPGSCSVRIHFTLFFTSHWLHEAQRMFGDWPKGVWLAKSHQELDPSSSWTQIPKPPLTQKGKHYSHLPQVSVLVAKNIHSKWVSANLGLQPVSV